MPVETYEDDEEEQEGPRSSFATYLAEGDTLFKQSEFKKALESYSLALELQPNDKICLVARSKCYLKLGDPQKALMDAEAALVEDKEFNKGLYRKAEALYCMGDFEYALMYYHRGHKLRPELDEFRLGIQKAQEAIDNSIGSAAKIKLENKGDLTFFMKQEDIVNKKRGYAKPTRTNIKLKPAIANRNKEVKPPAPSKKTVKQLLGEIYADKEYLEKLMEDSDFIKSKENQPIYELVQGGIDYLDTRTEFWRQQKPLYARKKEKDKRSVEKKKKKPSVAKYVLTQLEDIDQALISGDPERSLRLAQALLKVVEEASFRDLPNKNEVMGNIHSCIGNAFVEIELLNKALKHHQKDLDISKKSESKDGISRALDNIGRVFARMGKYDKAVKSWTEKIPLVKTSLENTWLSHEIGRCYLELEKYHKAKEFGEKSLAAAEECGDEVWQLNANVLIAQAQVKLDDLDGSVETFNAAYEIAVSLEDGAAQIAIAKALEDVQTKTGQDINDTVHLEIESNGEADRNNAETEESAHISDDDTKSENDETDTKNTDSETAPLPNNTGDHNTYDEVDTNEATGDVAPLGTQDNLRATEEVGHLSGTETEKEEVRRDDSENEYSQDDLEDNETSHDKFDKESSEQDTEVYTYRDKEEVSSDDKDAGKILDQADDDDTTRKEKNEVDSHDTQKEDLVRSTSDSEINQDNEGGDCHGVQNNDEILDHGNNDEILDHGNNDEILDHRNNDEILDHGNNDEILNHGNNDEILDYGIIAEETEKQEPLRKASDDEDIESEHDERKNEFNVSKEEDSNENNNGNAEKGEEAVEEILRRESSDIEKVVDSEAGNEETFVDDKEGNTDYFDNEGMEIEPNIKSNALEQEEIDTDDEERCDEKEQSKEREDHNENEESSAQAIKNTDISSKDNEIDVNTENILGQNEKASDNQEKDEIRGKKHDENELGVNAVADNGEEDAGERELDPSAENPQQESDSTKSNGNYVMTENVKQEDGQNELENDAASEQGSSVSLPGDPEKEAKTDADDDTSEMIKSSRYVKEALQLDTEDLLSTNENDIISNRDVETNTFGENDLKRGDDDQPEQAKESYSEERVLQEQNQLKRDKEESHELRVDDNHLSEDVNETDKTIQHSGEAKITDDKIVESADSNKIAKGEEMSKKAESIGKVINFTEMNENTLVNTENV